MSAPLQRAILSSRDLRNEFPLQAQDISGLLQENAVIDSKEGGVTPNLRFVFDSPQDMAAFIKDHPRIRLLDCCFTDPIGQWHHCTFTCDHVDSKSLAEGFGFDASSIPMFERIDNSDFVMRPDPSTCWLDPFAQFPTLHVTASIFKPSGEPYDKCPRQILAAASNLLKEREIADELYFGPEAEFFLFNSARYSLDPHNMYFSLDADEAYWNYGAMKGVDVGNMENLGHRANIKEGYMTSRPVDKCGDVRSEMLLTLEQLGIKSEKHHHEVATCQMEVNIKAVGVLECADNLQILKYIVKNVALSHGKTATFMPKPLANDNGSGMHCNMSLWKSGINLFYDDASKFHQLSQIGFQFMSGILHHCPALLALACPTTNSYRRLVPDFEAPIHITYSAGNRSTAIRVPTFTNQKTKRIEFRSPDASCCPYLAFAAMILAGIDGITNDIPLPRMGEGNLFDPANQTAKTIRKSPASLDEALDSLEADHEFLTRDEVFSEKFISDFVKYRRKQVSELRCSPHPREFMLHYGC